MPDLDAGALTATSLAAVLSYPAQCEEFYVHDTYTETEDDQSAEEPIRSM